jgi:hypothetical protein
MTISTRKAAPIRRTKGMIDFDFLFSREIRIPRIKNSAMFIFAKKGDLEIKKKKISPIVNNTRASSGFFFERIVLKSKITEKDTNRAVIK